MEGDEPSVTGMGETAVITGGANGEFSDRKRSGLPVRGITTDQVVQTLGRTKLRLVVGGIVRKGSHMAQNVPSPSVGRR